MEFVYHFDKGGSTFSYYTVPGETLDEKTKEILDSGRANRFLLPLTVKKLGGGWTCTYDVAGMVNMMAWRSEVSPERQKSIDSEIAYIIESLKQLGIPREEILMEQENMYVKPETKEIRLMCFPIKGGEKHESGNLPLIPPEPGDSLSEEFLLVEEKMKEKKQHNPFRKKEKSGSEKTDPVSDIHPWMWEKNENDENHVWQENQDAAGTEGEDETVLLRDDGDSETVLLRTEKSRMPV